MTKDEALRLISERGCLAIDAKEYLKAKSRETCREMWPAESSEWCPSCTAQQAIDEADGTREEVAAMRACRCPVGPVGK
jgi:hypothetical protein